MKGTFSNLFLEYPLNEKTHWKKYHYRDRNSILFWYFQSIQTQGLNLKELVEFKIPILSLNPIIRYELFPNSKGWKNTLSVIQNSSNIFELFNSSQICAKFKFIWTRIQTEIQIE